MDKDAKQAFGVFTLLHNKKPANNAGVVFNFGYQTLVPAEEYNT
jgi:hypothetical protein